VHIVHRKISSVIIENEGRCAPHKVRHGLDEWEDPGDLRYDYGDYRQMQRSAFLISVLKIRLEEAGRRHGEAEGIS